MIQDSVLGNGHRDGNVTYLPPDSNPATARRELREWYTELDRLTTEYAGVMEQLEVKRYMLKYEQACARERAKRRPNPMDRRTTSDLDADVTRSSRVAPLEEDVVRLEARRDSLRAQMDNARMQIAGRRTEVESNTVTDPHST